MTLNQRLEIRPGKKVFITGQNGSGKSVGAVFLLEHQKLPVVAIDTKIEETLACLSNSIIIDGLENFQTEAISKARQNNIHNFIVRPTPNEMSADILDDFCYRLHDGCLNTCIYIDEAYPFHTNGRPGPGLIGLLTRGRSRGQTIIYGAQRPAWISVFCISEAQYMMVYKLNMPEDRKRMYEVTGSEKILNLRLDRNRFYWWDGDTGEATEFNPVPLPRNFSTRKILSKRKYRLI